VVLWATTLLSFLLKLSTRFSSPISSACGRHVWIQTHIMPRYSALIFGCYLYSPTLTVGVEKSWCFLQWTQFMSSEWCKKKKCSAVWLRSSFSFIPADKLSPDIAVLLSVTRNVAGFRRLDWVICAAINCFRTQFTYGDISVSCLVHEVDFKRTIIFRDTWHVAQRQHVFRISTTYFEV